MYPLNFGTSLEWLLKFCSVQPIFSYNQQLEVDEHNCTSK